MVHNSSSNQLLDPVTLGTWIFQRSHIWQMNFLTAKELADFVTKRGLPIYSEGHINHLWKLGLLRADLIVSHQEVEEAGFVFLGQEGDTFLYTDARVPQTLQDTPGLSLKEVQAVSPTLEILFHPFRFAVLHCIGLPVIRISPLQILCPQLYRAQEGMELWRQMIQPTEKDFYSTPYWNDVVSLLVATEPCFYERVFEHLHISVLHTHSIPKRWSQEDESDTINYPSFEALGAEIEQHWHDVSNHYYALDLHQLKELHQTLYIRAHMLDENTDVHRILHLGDEKLRLNLEGNLGGAMLFRTMAEFLRRATEEVFTVQLKEEDQWGDEAKERLLGSKRLFDGGRYAGNELLRQHGLSYGPRLRWYVEGDTEFGGLSDLFKDFGATDIEILNLKGQIVQKNQIAFRESLRSDLRMGIFSFVSLDKDVSRNTQVVKAAVLQDQICGGFFISDPDFEFENFDLSELQEIVWNIALELGADTTKKPILLEATKAANKGRIFEEGVKKASNDIPELWGIAKGEKWGVRLIQYALEHPYKLNDKERLCVKAIREAFASRTTSYNYSRRYCHVDPQTGQNVKRETPMTNEELLKEI